jgi:hypothetical protein
MSSDSPSLLTDPDQLNMLAPDLDRGPTETAVFVLFVHR